MILNLGTFFSLYIKMWLSTVIMWTWYDLKICIIELMKLFFPRKVDQTLDIYKYRDFTWKSGCQGWKFKGTNTQAQHLMAATTECRVSGLFTDASWIFQFPAVTITLSFLFPLKFTIANSLSHNTELFKRNCLWQIAENKNLRWFNVTSRIYCNDIK